MLLKKQKLIGTFKKSFVCAVLTSNLKTCVLRSYENEERREVLYDECKIWEACRATSAATSFFDPITIGRYRQQFADGGITNNNPIQLVYREAEDLWPSRIKDAVLVSIGTGSAPSPALEGSVIKIVQALKAIVIQTEATHQGFLHDHPRIIERNLFFRFNVYHGLAEVGLEEFKETAKIADATHNYLEEVDTRQRMRKCISMLLERPLLGLCQLASEIFVHLPS
jgi:predicted acylesterase/phospholipase RssA